MKVFQYVFVHTHHASYSLHINSWTEDLRVLLQMTKVKREKVAWFTGFHPNAGKIFVAFASFVLKVLPLLKAFI